MYITTDTTGATFFFTPSEILNSFLHSTAELLEKYIYTLYICTFFIILYSQICRGKPGPATNAFLFNRRFKLLIRNVDPHSLCTDPCLAVFLIADPDPTLF